MEFTSSLRKWTVSADSGVDDHRGSLPKPAQFAQFDADSASVGNSVGAQSLPTMFGKDPFRSSLDSHSIASDPHYHSAQIIDSQSHSLTASTPLVPRKYPRKGRRHMIHPLDSVLQTGGSSKPSLPIKKKVVEATNETLLTALPEISIAGRKFVPPSLPRIDH